jgi:hypothetical protein
MKINQLFRERVSEELTLRVVTCFGLKSKSDSVHFCKEDLVRENTLTKMKLLVEELKHYYLPCKAKVYLNLLNIQSCLTILRQVVRLYDKTLTSVQKYVNYKKISFYYLKDSMTSNKNTKQTHEGGHIDFS